MFLLGLAILVVGLLVSVGLHEIGHMVPAKKFKAFVPEYWIGFGPTVWSTKKGDTRYGVKALPLGGYVRILGMFPPSGRGPKTKADGSPTLSELARRDSFAELDEARKMGMKGRAFYELSTTKKLAVMFGGPLMNLLIAVVLIAIVTIGIGWTAPSTTIGEVREGDNGTPSAAMDAGLHEGDRVVAWGGEPVNTWQELTDLIAETTGPTTVTVDRDGSERVLTIEPQVSEGRPVVGIVSALERQRGTVGDVGAQVWTQVVATGKAIIALPVSLFDLGRSFFTGEERDSTGVVSVVGVARLAGDITAAPTQAGDGSANASGIPAGVSGLDRVALMLSLLASLNVALFVFNLIPLPPLDGGHIAGALWGGVRNVAAKASGKPKPAPADTARMVPLSYLVFAALMVMTVVLVVADLVKPITFA